MLFEWISSYLISSLMASSCCCNMRASVWASEWPLGDSMSPELNTVSRSSSSRSDSSVSLPIRCERLPRRLEGCNRSQSCSTTGRIWNEDILAGHISRFLNLDSYSSPGDYKKHGMPACLSTSIDKKDFFKNPFFFFFYERNKRGWLQIIFQRRSSWSYLKIELTTSSATSSEAVRNEEKDIYKWYNM